MYELEYQHEQALARERSRMAQDKLDAVRRYAQCLYEALAISLSLLLTSAVPLM